MIIDLRDALRLDDQPGLTGDMLVPVWVVPADWSQWSARRRAFAAAGVADVRAQLRARGSDLVIRQGDRAAVLNELALALDCGVGVARPAGLDERAEDRRITRLHYSDARTLYALDDLPFDAVPEPFTAFRKRVEKALQVAPPVPAPDALPPLPAGIEPGDLPKVDPVESDPRRYRDYQGGEGAAQALVLEYFASSRAGRYKKTRNAMHGAEGSTKFSPWLAQGSLSPRRVWQAVTDYESEHGKNDSTYWIRFELLWREYFQWWTPQQGAALFGSRQLPKAMPDFERWCAGDTGVPMVDANMRELNATGYMSNRGRQNVASFLAKDLGIDWRLGAAYFETHLIDYDVASNWGNWAYVAGDGADPRDDRWFNVLLQGVRYDPKGTYVRHWCDELTLIDNQQVHWPWLAGAPQPMVHPPRWHGVING